MQKILFVFTMLSAVALFGAQLDHWEYDSTENTVTDGEWKFAASLSSGNFTFGCVDTNYTPAVVTDLDFSKPITGIEGEHQVKTINTLFAWNVWATYGYAAKPIAKKVGIITIPDTVTKISDYALKGCVNGQVQNTAFMTNLTYLGKAAFMNTPIIGDIELPKITTFNYQSLTKTIGLKSVKFGSGLTSVVGTYGDGAIGYTTSLTNVMFDASSSVAFSSGFVFNYCSSLGPELDLSCATSATIDNSRTSNHYGYFQSCTALKRIIFSSKFKKLGRTTLFHDNSDSCNLEEVHFAGTPPTIADNTSGNTSNLKLGKNNKTVMSYVHLDPDDPNYASQLEAWGNYCQDGELNATSSVWKSELVGSINRPLRIYKLPTVSIASGNDAYALSGAKGSFTISRGTDVGLETPLVVSYSVGGTAVAGVNYAVLSGTVTIPAGTNSVEIAVTPMYEEGRTANTTLTLNLSAGGYLIGPSGAASIQVVNGVRNVKVERVDDADEGGGRIGHFVFTRSDPSSSVAVTINFVVGGTAVSGQTYAALPNSVTIPAGEESVKLEVVPIFDSMTIEDSTVVLTLSPGEYTRETGKSEATVRVINGASYGAWVFTPSKSGGTDGLMTDNHGWVFNASIDKSRGRIYVGSVHTNATEVPAAISPLDFSKFIISSESTNRYFIYSLSTAFGVSLDGSQGWARVGRKPASDLLGELTMPGEGWVSTDRLAFCGCTNATGIVKFPSTFTTFGAESFRNNSFTIDGESFPPKVTSISGVMFSQTKFTGPLILTNVITVASEAFSNTDITDVKFGPKLTEIGGGWSAGAFRNCRSLTNIVFDAASRFKLQQAAFAYCTKLTEVELYGWTTNMNTNTDWLQDVFSYCSSLKKVTIGPYFDCFKLNNAFAGCAKLEEIRFLGPPPAGFPTPWLNPLDKKQSVKTTIPVSIRSVKNSAGVSWNDMCEQGVVRSKDTTWKSTYLKSDITSAYLPNRQLITFDRITGIKLILR